MNQVCRTCLTVIENHAQLFSLEINTIHIKTKLAVCVPEIALNRVKNSVICHQCLYALNTAYEFKTKCLQTESKIFEYVTCDSIIDSTDLTRFVLRHSIISNNNSNAVRQCDDTGFPNQGVANRSVSQFPLPLFHYNNSNNNNNNMNNSGSNNNNRNLSSQPQHQILNYNNRNTNNFIDPNTFMQRNLETRHSNNFIQAVPVRLQNNGVQQNRYISPPPPPQPFVQHQQFPQNNFNVQRTSNNYMEVQRNPETYVTNSNYPLMQQQVQNNFIKLQFRNNHFASPNVVVSTNNFLRAVAPAPQSFITPPRNAVPAQGNYIESQTFALISQPRQQMNSILSAALQLPVQPADLNKSPSFVSPPQTEFTTSESDQSNVTNSSTCSNDEMESSVVFTCTVCSNVFASEDVLKDHFKSHDGLKCNSCDFHTYSTALLDDHIKTHSPVESTTTKKAKSATTPAPGGQESFHQCGLCNYRSRNSSSLRRHMKVHMGSRPFRCPQCRYGASDEFALQTHMKIHTKDRPHKCGDCPYKAFRRNKLRNHMLKVHNKVLENHEVRNKIPIKNTVDPYQISIDDIHDILKEEQGHVTGSDSALFESENANDPYMVTVADIEEILQNDNDDDEKEVFHCSVCQQPFQSELLLKRHMLAHQTSNKQLLKCKRCVFRTTNKSHYRVHVKLHMGGKVYKCDQCDYSTVYWSNMHKHNRVHTGEKPYKCPYCDYKVVKKSSLDNHILTHAETDVYDCNNTQLDLYTEVNSFGNHFIRGDFGTEGNSDNVHQNQEDVLQPADVNQSDDINQIVPTDDVNQIIQADDIAPVQNDVANGIVEECLPDDDHNVPTF